MSTESKLKEAQVKLEQANTDCDAMELNRTNVSTEIAELKAKLAEEQKPKLRHGDYGLDCMGSRSVIAINQGGRLVKSMANGYTDCYNAVCIQNHRYPVLGNIFDDLKAIQEDVTEFEIEGCGFKLRVTISGTDIAISVIEPGQGEMKTTYIPQQRQAELVLKLRQMGATVKRNQQ